MDFETINLEEEQKRLLIALVEASRKQPRGRRQRFLAIQASGGTVFTGLEDFEGGYIGDVETLINSGFLNGSKNAQGALVFDVSLLGYRYYEYLMQSKGAPAERIEEYVFRYLDAAAFEKRHPEALAKWEQAQELLWGSDSQDQHTVIGHHCREAMQFFATSLVELYQPPDVEQDITKTIKRVEAVLKQYAEQMSDSVVAMLVALLDYWGAINDLAQRQEHGAQKEGEVLTWEDSRRMVFQTAIVMFEIDRALQDCK